MPGIEKYADQKGRRDRGPKEFKSHKVEHDGDIMYIASTKVVSTHPANTIKNVAELMQKNDVRRIPITDAGTHRLQGIAKATDILDFLGGGPKYNIITEDYQGNFLAAINCPIQKIMAPATYLTKKATIDDAAKKMLQKKTSAIPIVEDEEDLIVSAIVTERDILPQAKSFGVTVAEAMTKDVITSSQGMMLSDVSKIMVRNQIRRLPVIQEDAVAGVVTVFDILKYLADGDYKGVDAEENLSTRVADIMEPEVVAVRPENDIASVAALVKETGLGGFPVASDGQLQGIITTTDIIRETHLR